MKHAADYGYSASDAVLECRLCPANCRLTEGKHGICRSRFVESGRLWTDNYGELVTLAVDPIEKKPLYHFYPGTRILSTGPNCCNLGCLHCQNWSISQEPAPTQFMSPEALTAEAARRNTLGVAFTYAEPTVWFEYIRDTAPLLRACNQKVVLVTNGYINSEPLNELLRLVDAMNIDLKGMRREFYLKICKGKLDPVLNTIRAVAASPVHLELTNLVIPGENDSRTELLDLVAFVAGLSDRMPLHFSAYHPDYQMDRPATPPETLAWIASEARKRLAYVYVGNMAGFDADTRCPGCGATLVRRHGFHADPVGLDGQRCRACGIDADFKL